MFGIFKKQASLPESPLETLLKKQTPFAVYAVISHGNLLKTAPDPEKAILEIFLYNLWVCYHVIGENLCSSLPQPTLEDRQVILRNLRVGLAVDGNQTGAPALYKHYRVRVTNFFPKNFDLHIERTMVEYDKSVSNHDCPAWNSAAIKLNVRCGISPATLIVDMHRQDVFVKEAYAVFRTIQSVVVPDCQNYLSTQQTNS